MIVVQAGKGQAPIVQLDGNDVLPPGENPRPPLRALYEQLSIMENNWKITHPKEIYPRQAILFIHEQAPWSLVAAVLQTLGESKVGVAFEVEAPVAAPQPGAIARELEELRRAPWPDKHSLWLELLKQQLLSRCFSAQQSFEQLQKAQGEDVNRDADRFFKEVPDDLLDCDCAADLEAVWALLYSYLYSQPVGVVWLQLSPQGSALALPPDRPWREAWQALIDEKQPIAVESKR